MAEINPTTTPQNSSTESKFVPTESDLMSETPEQRAERLHFIRRACADVIEVELRKAGLDSVAVTARCLGNALSSDIPTVNAKLNAINHAEGD